MLAPRRTQLDMDFTVEQEGRREIQCQGDEKWDRRGPGEAEKERWDDNLRKKCDL